MNLGLSNKVAIITGGSQGIGKAAALRLALEGAKVVICARRMDMLDEAAQEIRDRCQGQADVLPVEADMTRDADIRRVMSTTVDSFGGLNILVNNAGKSAAASFETVQDEDWKADIDLKLLAAVRFCRIAIPEMRRAGGGRIINVTNLGGKTPGANSVPTSVTRAAGIALTKALSKEFAKDNILVNTVCIGLIKSGQHEARYAALAATGNSLSLDAFYQQIANERDVPLGRVGEAAEAGDVIAFLASEAASYLTGTSINIDGGASAVM